MPSYSGRVEMAGLRGEVRVWSDGYGVPHIFATDMNWPRARSAGCTPASGCFRWRSSAAPAQGRLAEMLGPDLVARRSLHPHARASIALAESSFAALSPSAQARLQAYADGVNALARNAQRRLPPEFLILGDDPEPWRPADSLVWGKLLALQLSHNYKIEMLRARARREARAEQAGWIFPDLPPELADHHARRRRIRDHAALDVHERARRAGRRSRTAPRTNG